MWNVRSRFVFLLLLTLGLAPFSARAAETSRTPRGDISIEWNGELDRAHGIRSGRGTVRDPFVISGWALNNLRIRDTDKAIRIVDNTISGTLTLDWVGPNIEVRGNRVGDLRVNQNNARWGDPTSGSIRRNTFTTVGQLRHFDGSFMENTVGSPQSGLFSSSYPDTRAVNFDGFNGAHFMHNTIYGFVDARLHGHHHSSEFGGGSHMHAGGPHAMAVDHTKRFHEVWITHNHIYTSAPYALAYLDTGHAGNDRTANSETNPYLNAPHVHFTRAHLTSNMLHGAGILVNVFNARDDRHSGRPDGVMEISGNSIMIDRDPARPLKAVNGIEVRQARFFTLRISANTIEGAMPLVDVVQLHAIQSPGSGVLLDDLDAATVLIEKTKISYRQFGVQALRFTKSVRWTIKGLTTTGVAQPVAYDKSVANPPQRA